MKYARVLSKKNTGQFLPIPGEKQIRNSAGGFVYAVDKWQALRRFLVLGTEGGSYYASEQSLTLKNAKNVVACAQKDGARTVVEIVQISEAGRAPKNDPAVFALAVCLAYGDDKTKQLVCEALPRVCRIGTHLFHFTEAVSDMRGWGKMLRMAIASWYASKSVKDLAFQVVKYQQRDGWSHKDLLRLAHVHPENDVVSGIYEWICRDKADAEKFAETEAKLIWAAVSAKSMDKDSVIELIKNNGLPREAVPTQYLKDRDIWAAMLPTMGLTAIIRNLANMTRYGLITQGTSEETGFIINRIRNKESLKKARVHPIQILSALKTYSGGTGIRGRGVDYAPNQRVVDALDEAFYKAFDNIKPTGKRYLLALDVSGSMSGGEIAGVPGLTPRVASAAMAMVTLAAEEDVQTIAFTCGADSEASYYNRSVYPISLSTKKRLDDVLKYLDGMPFSGTDCALPMIYAMKEKIMVDVFVIYTDNETWAGDIHPAQALREYRKKFNPDAKLIVVGMVSNGFSIADPNDPGMLDVVGFDSATPALMADFSLGRI